MPNLVDALLSPLGAGASLFWLWMIGDCYSQERGDRRLRWLGLVVLLHGLGALLYWLLCWWPRQRQAAPKTMPKTLGGKLASGWHRTAPKSDKEVALIEADARHIGKAHQFVRLGDLRHDRGEFDLAEAAYQQAIAQEPDHPKALWGLANIALTKPDLLTAQDCLAQLLAQAPDFQFGAALTLYSRVLFDLGELDRAQIQLETERSRRREPVNELLLARILQRLGEPDQARQTLEALILQIEGAPPYYHRQHQPTLVESQTLLKGL